MNQPPKTRELLAYLLGESSAEQAEHVKAAAGQADVAQRLAALTRMLTDLEAMPAHQVATHLTDAHLATLVSTTAPGAGLGSRLSVVAQQFRQVVSTLVFDSFRAPEISLGFRGGASNRLVRFELEGGHVDFRLAPDESSEGHFWVTGEVAGGDVVSAHLRDREGAVALDADVGQDGSFEWRVEAGQYEVQLDSRDARVTVQLPPVGVKGV